MLLALKIILLLMVLVSVTLLVGGCSAPRARGDVDLFRAYTRADRNYFADRGYDLLDIVSVSIEWPVIGATATLGPAKFGLMASSHPSLQAGGSVGFGLKTETDLTGFGLRCGQVGTYRQEENVLLCAWDDPPFYDDITRAYSRAKTGTIGNWSYSRRPLYARVGTAIGLGVGLRTEVNFGELADFFLGVVGVDVMNDDLGRRLRGATRLYMPSAQFAELPAAIGDFETLQYLNLEGNTLRDLPDTFSRLHNLQELDLTRNRFAELPEVLSRLHRLDSLNLGGNLLAGTLSPRIGALASLSKLTLYNNQLEFLPDEIGQLQHLSSLQLDHNRLQSLPETIGALQQLQTLDVTHNQLRTLPAGVGTSSVSRLRLNDNQIDRLPPEIGNLRYLRELNLTQNALGDLPPELGRLEYLETLELQNNRIRSVPPELGGLKRLTSLQLQDNQLSSLAPELGGLRSLYQLDLSRNPLGHIPRAVFALESLRSLSLDEIGLAELPEEIGRLRNLRGLTLDGNRLTTLPLEVLAQLPQLEKLSLHGNNFSCAEMKRIYRTLEYRVDFGEAFYACPDRFSAEE